MSEAGEAGEAMATWDGIDGAFSGWGLGVGFIFAGLLAGVSSDGGRRTESCVWCAHINDS